MSGSRWFGPASIAFGSCSITVPARIVITSNGDAVTATAGSDCAASSLAYSASSRHAEVVYVNGLIHQWSMDDTAVGAGRTVYLLRYLPSGWQTMLSRTADAQGRLAVGFSQPTVYQYRWVATETSEQWAATSASTFR